MVEPNQANTASGIDVTDFLRGELNPNVPQNIRDYANKFKERALALPEANISVFIEALEKVRYSPSKIFKRKIRETWKAFLGWVLRGHNSRKRIKEYADMVTKMDKSSRTDTFLKSVPLHEFMFEFEKDMQEYQKRMREQHA